MLINFAAFVVVVAGIMAAKSLVVPFLLAAFLAVICAPPAYWLRTRKVPTVVSILLLVLVVVLVEMVLATLVTSSMAEFSHSMPQYQERLHVIFKDLIIWLGGHGIELREHILMDQFDPGKLMHIASNMLNNLFGMLTNTFMVMLTLVFILLEASGFIDKLKAVTGAPDGDMERYERIISGVNRYMALKTVTSMITAVLVAVGLKIIGVDFALMWGVLAFLLNFVPTIGSIIAAVPPVLLAVVQLGTAPALATAGLYLAINMVIGNILEPKIMGSGVGLSPLVIFVSMAFWGWVLGPVGMLLSVPLTMTLKIGLGCNEKTRSIALLLGSNGEAKKALMEQEWEK
jgi:predicted PurR-regulated permease PerM